jgi:hypothetical protein
MKTKTTYTKVSEATPNTAFLEFPCGYELVTLHRVMPDEVQSSNHDKEHAQSCLTDEQWQDTIDLINAAPDLLEALAGLVNTLTDLDRDNAVLTDPYGTTYTSSQRSGIRAKAILTASKAIAKATGEIKGGAK